MTTPIRVLVVDDDPVVLRATSEVLRRGGCDVISLSEPVEAVAIARDDSIDVVLSDIQMPHLSGLALLKAFKAARPDVEVILMTGYATVETALESVRAGAYDYLLKPFERIDVLSSAVARAAERRALKRQTVALEEALVASTRFEGIIGQSPQMQAVFKLVEAVSPSSATVLIRGESGTGKELVAKAIHAKSPRRAKPFLAVNCSALTETLLESELFGHVKGAFTGAIGLKKGLFEAAHGGTIFLDEIGDIPLATQVRLLRVLQEGVVKRVGANEDIEVDVRVVAATHVDLEKAKAERRFREDLYYRLNVISLQLPALRERPSDIPLLAQHFLKVYSEGSRKLLGGIASEALEQLVHYAWPGNVRELENAIERAVVLANGPTLTAADLPASIVGSSRVSDADVDFSSLAHLPFAQAKSLSTSAFERRYLAEAMRCSAGNVSAAALAAGMDRSNFRRLLKEHSMNKPQGPEEPS